MDIVAESFFGKKESRDMAAIISVAVIIGIFTLDSVIKGYIEAHVEEGSTTKKLGGHILIRRHHNRGAMLNAGQYKRRLVAFVSVVVLLGALTAFVLTIGKKGCGLLRAGLTLILGGGFSNTCDRLKRKYVVDYISFPVKWEWLRNIVFNLSDFCIMAGACLVLLSGLTEGAK